MKLALFNFSISFDRLTLPVYGVAKTLFPTVFLLFGSLLSTSAQTNETCHFLIPDNRGNAIQGPSLVAMNDGFLQGVLDCGSETHHLMVMTIDVDTSQKHIGVRDDPLFTIDVTGELRTIRDVPVSATSNVHVFGRVNQSPLIGVRRGFVRFATLCDADEHSVPLDCSWGTSRIKFRSTTLDTNADEEVDRSYHELSVYRADGRLHMITFWTPHRGKTSSTTQDWISALRAVGVDIMKAG